MENSLERPLLARWPALADQVPWCGLGEFPSPLDSLSRLAPAAPGADGVFVKRDDICSQVYGGNKIRTLETLFGEALHLGAEEIWSTGFYGSNHATATVLHAGRVGLRAGSILYPQTYSETAAANLRVTVARGELMALPHWSLMPYGMLSCRRAGEKLGVRRFVMVPGGATPVGALGYVSAALELGIQLAERGVDSLERIVLGVGSTCTTAGLLVGVHLARRVGLFGGPAERCPIVHAVRVTTWPVTSTWRIVRLAARTSELLARLGVPRALLPSAGQLRAVLVVDGSQLGAGYGKPTLAGARAREQLGEWGEAALDTTYTEKSAAGLLAHLEACAERPVVYWATKSSVPLPEVSDGELAHAPARVQRFLSTQTRRPRRARPGPHGVPIGSRRARLRCHEE